MTQIRFEWDESKNLSNQRKHGVSFGEASQIFRDPLHLVVAERTVEGEQRWQAMGSVRSKSGTSLLLIAAHTFREEIDDGSQIEIVRIISARKATREERRIYEEE